MFDLKTQSPVYVLQAHADVITQMKWLEKKQMLITLAKDKSIKFWRFPKTWIDESSVASQIDPGAQQPASDSSSDDEREERASPKQEPEDPRTKPLPAAPGKPLSNTKREEPEFSDSDEDLSGWNN